jgi:hypothetical protein
MISFCVSFVIFLIKDRIILNSDIHKRWLMFLGILLVEIPFLHINFVKLWKSFISSIILFINILLLIGSININWLKRLILRRSFWKCIFLILIKYLLHHLGWRGIIIVWSIKRRSWLFIRLCLLKISVK